MILKFKYTFSSAIKSIKINATRSFLTVLGIVIGVAAIIIIMSLGNGAQNLILGEISQMGSETVIILPGELADENAIFSDSLTPKDVDRLEITSNVPNLVELMPFVVVPGQISYRGETYAPAIMVGGSAEFFAETYNTYPSAGTLFNEVDILNRSRSVVIGSKVKEELFGLSDAVGERVFIKNVQFRVVGVYPKTGQKGMFDIDDFAIMPYTTAQTYILGTNYFHRIIAKADNSENVSKMARDIEATLRESHSIYPGEEDDFSVMTQEGLIEQVSTIIGILTAFLAAVVAISLVVGGIGVMNIMLVSVTERTKEIGLRKALGATKKAILSQFLMEAIVLTLTGGILGIIIGSLFSFLVSLILTGVLGLDWQFNFPINAALLGVFASASVGLIFGLYPAKRAADKSPIEALHYE